MRNWIKQIIMECLKECIKNQPLIVSNRPPTEIDIFQKGSIWRFGEEKWIAGKSYVDWEKIE